MNGSSSPNIRSGFRAFSLLELLVVIAILGILAGIVYPASLGVMKKVRMARAENSALHLRNAIQAYVTEYRRLPLKPARLEETDVSVRSDHELMNALCASPKETEPSGLNPRGTVFFQDRTARPLGEGRYHSGVRYGDGDDIDLYDPWGENFRVVLDSDSNGRVARPVWDRRDSGLYLVAGLIVWSAGPDQDDGTESDNVATW